MKAIIIRLDPALEQGLEAYATKRGKTLEEAARIAIASALLMRAHLDALAESGSGEEPVPVQIIRRGGRASC